MFNAIEYMNSFPYMIELAFAVIPMYLFGEYLRIATKSSRKNDLFYSKMTRTIKEKL